MSEAKNPTIPRDPNRVNVADSKEVKYWAAQLGVTAKQLTECASRVGVNLKDVKRALGK